MADDKVVVTLGGQNYTGNRKPKMKAYRALIDAMSGTVKAVGNADSLFANLPYYAQVEFLKAALDSCPADWDEVYPSEVSAAVLAFDLSEIVAFFVPGAFVQLAERIAKGGKGG
jgi:hypothetical protein